MRMGSGRIRRAIATAGLVTVAAGCGAAPSGTPRSASPSAGGQPTASGTAAVVWPAPPDPMDRAVAAGLKPQPKEFLAVHVHAHLDVFVDAKRVVIPAGIGINIDDPAVHRGPGPDGSLSYGGISLCNDPCISPLHTHDVTGVLHTESTEAKPNTLGEFFTEWNVALDGSCVGTFCSPSTTIAIYVDGELATGDPRAIELTNHREIAIVIGTPPPEIPRDADFSNA